MPQATTQPPATKGIAGLPLALAAHAIWGIMPVYLVFVRAVPPLEFVAWRILFTLPLCLAMLALRRQFAEVRQAFGNPRTLLALVGSSMLIGINWMFYVVAIQTDHVYAASLGYYILPLVMMVLGLLVLKERLSPLQWAAVALAAIGVTLLALGALSTLWFSAVIAATFGLYGLIRKLAPIGALAGMTIETLLLYPPALGVVTWFALQPEGSSISVSPALSALIAFGGPMTAVPLMLFAAAARQMDYTLVGFVQFVSPTIVFLLGLFWFGEALSAAQLGCFLLIWAAMALFVWDMLRRRPG